MRRNRQSQFLCITFTVPYIDSPSRKKKKQKKNKKKKKKKKKNKYVIKKVQKKTKKKQKKKLLSNFQNFIGSFMYQVFLGR